MRSKRATTRLIHINKTSRVTLRPADQSQTHLVRLAHQLPLQLHSQVREQSVSNQSDLVGVQVDRNYSTREIKMRHHVSTRMRKMLTSRTHLVWVKPRRCLCSPVMVDLQMNMTGPMSWTRTTSWSPKPRCLTPRSARKVTKMSTSSTIETTTRSSLRHPRSKRRELRRIHPSPS